MKKAKAPRIIAGILFILYGIVEFWLHYINDQRVVTMKLKSAMYFRHLASFTFYRGHDLLQTDARSGGILAGALLLVALILVGVGLLSGKRAVTAIGGGFALFLWLLRISGLLFAIDRSILTHGGVLEFMRMRTFNYVNMPWPMLALNLLMLLVLVMLFIGALVKRAAKVLGWIGGGLALLRILPLSLLESSLMYARRPVFRLSLLGVIVTLVLAAAVVLAGYGLHEPREKKAPAVRPYPTPMPAGPGTRPNGAQAPQMNYQPPQGASYQPPQGASYQPPQGVNYQPPQGASYQPPQGANYQPPQGANYRTSQPAAPAQPFETRPGFEKPAAPLTQADPEAEEPAPETGAAEKPAAAPQLDPVETLRRFKGLLDDGIITPEEYEAKKKQLLDM